MTDSYQVLIHKSELRELVSMRAQSDPPQPDINYDILDDYLDRAAAELGFVGWVDALHELP